MSIPRILFYFIIYLSTNPTIIELLSFSVCLACTLCGGSAHSPYSDAVDTCAPAFSNGVLNFLCITAAMNPRWYFLCDGGRSCHVHHLERVMGFGPTTQTLAKSCSTTELYSHVAEFPLQFFFKA